MTLSDVKGARREAPFRPISADVRILWPRVVLFCMLTHEGSGGEGRGGVYFYGSAHPTQWRIILSGVQLLPNVPTGTVGTKSKSNADGPPWGTGLVRRRRGRRPERPWRRRESSVSRYRSARPRCRSARRQTRPVAPRTRAIWWRPPSAPRRALPSTDRRSSSELPALPAAAPSPRTLPHITSTAQGGGGSVRFIGPRSDTGRNCKITSAGSVRCVARRWFTFPQLLPVNYTVWCDRGKKLV